VIVVDASAVVDALAAPRANAGLVARLTDEELTAPSLLDFEVVSALRRLTLSRELTAGRGEDLLTDFDSLPIERFASGDGLRRRVFQLRHALSTYDGAYVALAEAIGCPLVTRDARLGRSGGHAAAIDVY